MEKQLKQLDNIASSFEKRGNFQAGAILTHAMRKISQNPAATNILNVPTATPANIMQTMYSNYTQSSPMIKNTILYVEDAVTRAKSGDGRALQLLQAFANQYAPYMAQMKAKEAQQPSQSTTTTPPAPTSQGAKAA